MDVSTFNFLLVDIWRSEAKDSSSSPTLEAEAVEAKLLSQQYSGIYIFIDSTKLTIEEHNVLAIYIFIDSTKLTIEEHNVLV